MGDLLTDEEIAERLHAIKIGPVFRCSPRAIEKGLPISHATDHTGKRTLCGRDASAWMRDPASLNGPDCHRCTAVWEARGAAKIKPASE